VHPLANASEATVCPVASQLGPATDSQPQQSAGGTPIPRPKLRDDLVISQQSKDGKPVVVIKDPVTGRFFRFGEIEGFILQNLDGNRRPAELPTAILTRFGASLSEESLQQFIQRLQRLGFLDLTGSGATSSRRVKRMGGDAFYFRFKAFSPDRLFARLAESLGFFFTSSFVVSSATVVVLALGITLMNWTEISREFRGIFQLQSLLLAWVTVILVIVAHEFAHGLTCRHFCGAVQELGFILIYFQPTFFCNVSDAWLFPEKSKRMWVSFAGAYF